VTIEPGAGAPETRVSDEDRAQMVELLRTHTAEGRLTLDEFSERVAAALAATNRGELDQATAGLVLPSGQPTPMVTRRARMTRWVVAIMSGNGRKGRWRTGSHVTAVAIMGGCDIDFRQAEFESDEIIVTAVAVMGGINITVPEGIAVELTGFPLMGGKNLKVADVPVIPGSPRIVVRAFPVMGGVDVRSRPLRSPKETRAALKEAAQGVWRDIKSGDTAALPAASELQESVLRHVNERVAREIEKVERRSRKIAERHGVDLRRNGGHGDDRGLERGPDRSSPRRSGPQWGPGPDLGRPRQPGEAFAGVWVPGLGTYGLRWGMELEKGEEQTLPEESALSAVPAAPDGTVTILFSDVCGYTELNERLGDIKTHELLKSYQQAVRAQLTAYEGYEVKVQGDGIMVAFSGASRALRCAIAIQRVTDDWGKEHGEPIRIHQGLHTGETVRENGDFLGRTVILASRITGEAQGSEILVSSVLKELTSTTGEFRFGEEREVNLKGVTVAQMVHPVQW
jgi:class 3 adenylate cyclase